MHVDIFFFKIINVLMQNKKVTGFCVYDFQKNMMHFNRKYSKHTSLEIMHYKIGGYFCQRWSISKRNANANMFSLKIIIVGYLNRPVHP